MASNSRLQNRLVARQLRQYIEEELAWFKTGGGQPPESDDVQRGIERAKIAISRAFVTFGRQHT